MTMIPGIFGLESGTLNTVVELAVLGAIVIWLALVWYTYADARRRVEDTMLIGSATLAAIVFPLLGTMVYVIVRPPEFLDDVRERELEIAASEARLVSQEFQLCPHCDAPAGRDFVRCPHCLRRLRETCGGCARPLDADWLVCPYCDTDIPGVTPPRRSRRGADQDLTGDADTAFADDELHAPLGDATLVADDGSPSA